MITFETIEKRASGYISNQWLALTIVTLAIVAAFFPTFGNELMTGWDDQWQVVNEFTSSGFTLDNLIAIFTETVHGQYSPLNQLMYTAIYSFAEYNPFYYHAASLLLHILNSWLVFTMLKKILLSTTSITPERTAWICFLTTMLFAIHPLQVETVAWMSASKILLCTFFYLLATYAFILYIEKKRLSFYLLAIVLFVCAYGAKEQAVVFPLWLVLLCSFYKMDLKKRETWRMVLPFIVLALFFGLLFVINIKNAPLGSSTFDYSWWQRFVFSCYSIVEYPLKWILPYKLLYVYAYPMNPNEPLPVWLLSYPLCLLIIVASLWKYINNRIMLTGGLFFLLHVILVLHIVPISRPHIIADRYVYFANIGISFVLLCLLVKRYLYCSIKVRAVFSAIILFVLLSLGIYTYHRTRVWYNTDTLKREILDLRVPS